MFNGELVTIDTGNLTDLTHDKTKALVYNDDLNKSIIKEGFGGIIAYSKKVNPVNIGNRSKIEIFSIPVTMYNLAGDSTTNTDRYFGWTLTVPAIRSTASTFPPSFGYWTIFFQGPSGAGGPYATSNTTLINANAYADAFTANGFMYISSFIGNYATEEWRMVAELS